MRSIIFVPVAVLALVSIGCGSKQSSTTDPSQQQYGYAQPGYQQTQPGYKDSAVRVNALRR